MDIRQVFVGPSMALQLGTPWRMGLTLVLALLAWFGNVFNVELVYGVNFIFGSVLAVLALPLLGVLPALLVAVAGGAYTWMLWGHPYALVVFTCELLVVAWLFRRGQRSLVLAGLMYWIVLGMPLVFLFYKGVLGLPWAVVTMVALKQALNGVFNALLASLVLLLLQLQWSRLRVRWLGSPRLQDILFQSMLVTILLAGGIPVIMGSQASRAEQEAFMEERLLEDARRTVHYIETEAVSPANATVSRDQTYWEKLLAHEILEPETGLALVNAQGQVLASAGRVASAGDAGQAKTLEVRSLREHLAIWLPAGNMSMVQRWARGRYLVSMPVKLGDVEGRLVVEHPAEPLVRVREAKNLDTFIAIFVVLLLGVSVATLVSRWIGRPLSQLGRSGHDLIGQISRGQVPDLPGSAVQEIEQLSNTLRDMSAQLAGSFRELRRIQADLEREVHSRTAELREQAQHTQAILDNMVDGIITIDVRGSVQSMNPAAERIFGYSVDRVIGKNIKMLMPQPYRDNHDSYLRNYLATGVARIIGIGREVEGLRSDGSQFPMELAVSEITRAGERLFVGMVRDVSERKRIDRLKSEFVSTVSHELRTPLTSISGALGLVDGGALGDMSPQARHMISIARKNSLRLTNLINDLLDIEKLAAGKINFDMQHQALEPLVQQSIDAIRPFAVEQQVELNLDVQLQGVKVNVDSQRFTQVMANLLSNAIKFSSRQGEVKVALEPHGAGVRVSVRDDGPGIPAAFRDRIFQKFAQADSSDTREKGGTGLGLAITKELVERMGGHIGFDSVEGQGACFHVDLPVVAESADHAQPAPDFPSPPVGSPSLLVVDDEPDVLQLLGLMLTRAGYRVDLVSNGQQALQRLADRRYDAVCLDLLLPDIDGLEVIRRIRERPATANLPVVVVSAKVEEGRLTLNGDFSRIDWLAKPIDEQGLLAAIRRYVICDEGHRPHVLHVEDDSDLHEVIRTMVGDSFDFELATTVAEARARIVLERFDVVILDLTLPDGSGWDLVPQIRSQQPEARIVVMSGNESTHEQMEKVEATLLKSQVSARSLLDVLSCRIRKAPKENRE